MPRETEFVLPVRRGERALPTRTGSAGPSAERLAVLQRDHRSRRHCRRQATQCRTTHRNDSTPTPEVHNRSGRRLFSRRMHQPIPTPGPSPSALGRRRPNRRFQPRHTLLVSPSRCHSSTGLLHRSTIATTAAAIRRTAGQSTRQHGRLGLAIPNRPPTTHVSTPSCSVPAAYWRASARHNEPSVAGPCR